MTTKNVVIDANTTWTAKLDLYVNQGATFTSTLFVTDRYGDVFPLAGYNAASQMKRNYSSANSVSFTTAINSAAGSIALSLAANQTSTAWPGQYVYDLLLTDSSNNVTRLVEGIVTVKPGVTNETLETWSNTVSYEAYFSNT